jgi:hypothetical protein
LITLGGEAESNVVKTHKNRDRAWRGIDPVRGVLRDTHTHKYIGLYTKEEIEAKKQITKTYTYT